MKVKKIVGLFLSAVMAVTATAVFTVSASAESIAKTAKAAESGKTYSANIKSDYGDYKFDVSEEGTLKLTVYSYITVIGIQLLDKSGDYVKPSSASSSEGDLLGYGQEHRLVWSSAMEDGKASFKYNVEKGTYYLRLIPRGYSGKVSFKATFPTAEEESKITFTSFVLPMKVGDTITLGTDLSDTTQTITWKSSKTSVATVTKKGKITAKAAGTATITATVGSTVLKIMVKVTK